MLACCVPGAYFKGFHIVGDFGGGFGRFCRGGGQQREIEKEREKEKKKRKKTMQERAQREKIRRMKRKKER